ncbi:MAG: carboxypeptidase-like regulatory domain-containing protein, partial [Fidelibacterota bacterium]
MIYNDIPKSRLGHWTSLWVAALIFSFAFAGSTDKKQSSSPGLSQTEIQQITQLRKEEKSVPQVKLINPQRAEKISQREHRKSQPSVNHPSQDVYRALDSSLFPRKSRRHQEFLDLGQRLLNNNRDLVFGSGFLSSDSDSVYFEFATGMNGSDTSGMDIMISGNEGVNFGSESGFGPAFSNPSQLFFLNPNGSLSQVGMVPAVDDSMATWTTISWDWNGGNNGSYLQPGNIWVIYTRTTNAYAVLEVTASSGADGVNPWFEFNYMYQPDGSTIFNPPQNLLEITVNGVHADTVQVGDSLVFRVTFPENVFQAYLQIWADMNDNGTLEPDVDIDVDSPGEIIDNGMDDEDPQPGVYQWTISGDDNDGPQRFADLTFLVEANTMMGGHDVASVRIEPVLTDYSISGLITPAEAHILLMAVAWDSLETDTTSDPLIWGAGTDSNGAYQVFLPDTGTYALMAFDFLGVTNGLIPDTMYFDIPVQGHETGYDFNFVEPNSVIAGMVTDEFMSPIPDLRIWIDNDGGPGFQAFTDSSGYFHVPVPPGDWRVGVDKFGLIPDYLIPEDEWVFLEDYDSVFVNIMAYTADAEIAGMVSLNDAPWINVNVGAWSDIGWTEGRTDSTGHYVLNVSSAADDSGGYWVGIWDFIPPDVFFVEHPDIVLSGD